MKSAKTVPAIHDLSGVGRCALTVVMPVISVMGAQVCPVPTAVLSAHTAFSGIAAHDLTGFLPAYLAHWRALGLRFDAVYAGYLAGPEQAAIVEDFLNGQRDALKVLDPVMGDDGRLYTGMPEDMPAKWRGLCARADVVTPNMTEYALLTGEAYSLEPRTMAQAKKMLDAAGFSDAVISASNDLDEHLIASLKLQGAAINSWGVGTNLITSKDSPSFGGVYKLAAIMDRETGKFIPKIKLSENAEKITNPGNKTIQRIYEKDTGKIIADLICLADETYSNKNSLLLFDPIETWKKTLLAPGTYTLRELLVPVFQKGKCVYHSPKVMEIRDYCQRELDTLWEESRRLVNPHEVHVDLSNELWHMKKQLLDSYHFSGC